MIYLSKINFTFKALDGSETELSILPLGAEGNGESIDIPFLTEGIQVIGLSEEDFSLKEERVPKLYCRTDKSDLFKDVNLREETEYEFTVAIPLDKVTIKRKRASNPIFPFGNLKLSPYLSVNGPNSWFESKGITFLTGRLNFKSFAGVANLNLDTGLSIDNFELEVVSYKINYEDDFRNLLNEIADFHSELILSIDNPTEAVFKLNKEKENVSPQVLLLHLRRLMSPDRLPAALEIILSHPHYKLEYFNTPTPPSHAARPDILDIASNPYQFEWNRGGGLAKIFKGYTPEDIPEYDHDKTYDTSENRFIKFTLEELDYSLVKLQRIIPKSKINTHTFIKNSLNLIEEALSHPIFKQVGPFTHSSNSMVLQQRKGYKDVLQQIQSLEAGIQLESTINDDERVNGDLKAIHKLYEYWCYFKLIDCFRVICKSTYSSYKDLVVLNEKKYEVNLKEGGSSKVVFEYKGLKICIYYNRNFKGLKDDKWDGTYDNNLLHPDFNIEIINEKQNQKHWLHFDAKYKLDYQKLQKMLNEEENYDNLNYKMSDLRVAHAYKDAILGSRGVYVLYPDVNENNNVFVRHADPSYKTEFQLPSIGAFPLRPGKSFEAQFSSLQAFMKEALDIILESEGYTEELGFNK